MNDRTVTVRVEHASRLPNSTYGNPRYRITGRSADGVPFQANTAPNASDSYAVTNHLGTHLDRRAVLTFTLDGRGRIVRIASAS